MKKRILAMLLALSCAVSVLTPAAAAEETSLTRMEWVQRLVSAFNMTVEDDNYPDNYYSDVKSSDSGYRDLLVAVEFGVIDTETGGEFRPNDPATREFAAHTLNYCLGFQPDEDAGYTYADSGETFYPDDAQIAVTRGWFELEDGCFLPNQAVTSAEAEAMLADAARLTNGLEVSDNYESSWSLAADIIEIPDGTEVTVKDDSVVYITDCPTEIAAGSVFVVYLNGIPVPYIAGNVAQNDGITEIQVTPADDETVFEGIDAQGTIVGDLRQAEAAEDTELAYYVEATEQEYVTYEAAYEAAYGAAAVQKMPALAARLPRRTFLLHASAKLSSWTAALYSLWTQRSRIFPLHIRSA